MQRIRDVFPGLVEKGGQRELKFQYFTSEYFNAGGFYLRRKGGRGKSSMVGHLSKNVT